MTYALIGIRTQFSLGESTLSPKQIKKAATDLGVRSVVIADTMTVSSLVEVSRLRDENFDPRVGVRLRVVEDLLDAPELADPEAQDALKTRKNSLRPFYPKLYARNADGMRAIFKLLSRSFDDDRFYKVPRLTVSDFLNAAANNNVVVSTGDTDGLFTHPEWRPIWNTLAAIAGDRLWVELIPMNTPYYDSLNRLAVDAANFTEARAIVSRPVLHAPGDFAAFRMNMAIHNHSTMSRPFSMREPWIKDFAPQPKDNLVSEIKGAAGREKSREGLPPGNVWVSAFKATPDFLDQISYTWAKEPIALPSLTEDPDAAVARACAEGMKARMAKPCFGEVIPRAQLHTDYIPRLKYELKVLKDLKFATYFLVVADIVQWSKNAGIMVGPGRGSVGGSLVAYLMGITDIDPIRFGLLFERFINPSRLDLPDADLDFMSTRREEVISYIERRFGKECVAGISNYGEIGASSGMKDVGRVRDLKPEVIAMASKLVPKVHGQPVSLPEAAELVAEIAKFRDDHPALWKEAVALEGVMRSYGKHAAGVVVAGVPLTDRAVVEKRSAARVINWDMRVSEDMGLVKLDILGLSTLDTISRAVDYIHKRRGTVIDINAIPLDCAKTLRAFSEGRCQGVFQFEGGAARRILKDMARDSDVTFNDLVAANALNRPGPIDAGLVQKYVDGRNGDVTNELAHPNMGPALSETFNVIVYQEQVMRISVDLCGFTLTDADGLRKAMGKKSKDMMAKYKTQFIEGAEKFSGMSPSLAEALFDQIEVFAGYAFNKSHAAEYSMISYQCQWLKTHYPAEFFAAALSIVDEEKLASVVKDAEDSGIEILPPDINKSGREFVILSDDKLLIPFTRIKGLSGKASTAIMDVRQDGPIVAGSVTTTKVTKKHGEVHTTQELNAIEMLIHRLQEKDLKRFCHKGHIDALDKVGAFCNVVPGQQPSVDASRLKDQLILMPGLISRKLAVREKIRLTKAGLGELKKIIEDYKAVDPDIPHPSPTFGKRARFMVVFDCPNGGDEKAGKYASGRNFEYCRTALVDAGLDVNHGYWTALLKRIKEGPTPSPNELRTYTPFLEAELALLQPKLIIPLGSAAAKFFLPDLKGPVIDHVNTSHYLKKRDATVLVGFNPSMIYFDPSKATVLQSVFETAALMIAS